MPKLFILLLLIFEIYSQNIPCFIWKNSFLEVNKLTKDSSNIKIRTIQRKGWFGVGFSKENDPNLNSFSIISFVYGELFVFENHTQKVSTNTLNKFTTIREFGDVLDGIYQFSFEINNSLISDKRFIFFAQQEHETNLTMIIKHDSMSNLRSFDLNDTSIVYPTCDKHLSLTSRLFARHWLGYAIDTLLSVILCLFYVYFRNDQPLKSKFISPFLGVLYSNLNFFSYLLLGTMNYEEQSKSLCKITGFISYPLVQLSVILPALIMIRYSILLQVHLRKKYFIKKLKKLKKQNIENDKPNIFPKLQKILTKVDQIVEKIRKYFTIQQSQLLLIFGPIILFSLFEIGIFSIFASSNFVCGPYTKLYMRYLHIIGLGLGFFAFSFFFVLDFLLNLRNLLKCNLKKYIFEDDPFLFRLDFVIILLNAPVLILWAFVPLPNLIYALFSDILFYSGVFVTGGLSLMITILRKIFLSFKSRNSIPFQLTMQNILEDEDLREKFIDFTEFEWSTENIYFKMDIVKYNKLTDFNLKKKNALQMQENYLKSTSPLEVNLSGPSLNHTLKQIKDQNFDNELFISAEKEVNANLFDTLGRFIHSSYYQEYLSRNENIISTLGLNTE
jgi:hypothetical protein